MSTVGNNFQLLISPGLQFIVSNRLFRYQNFANQYSKSKLCIQCALGLEMECPRKTACRILRYLRFSENRNEHIWLLLNKITSNWSIFTVYVTTALSKPHKLSAVVGGVALCSHKSLRLISAFHLKIYEKQSFVYKQPTTYSIKNSKLWHVYIESHTR